jgi:hypothetical protein
MGKILTEISEAELLDKIIILEIKLSEIKNEDLLKEINKEYTILMSIKKNNIEFSDEVKNLYNLLKETNKKIWDIENEKRICEKNSDFKENFIKLSRNEYIENDNRAKIKSKINEFLDSNIKEVKQHSYNLPIE